MKTANKIVITTVIFFLIASILVIFFVFQQDKIKVNPVVAINNVFFGERDNKKYNQSLPDNAESKLKLLFFGDLMIDRNVKNKIDKYGFDYLFATSSDSKINFDGYDLVSANLEGAVTNGGAHHNPAMAYDFAFAPDNVLKLKKHGFSFFNIANNHLADQGERGIIETRENLQKLGLNFSGCDDKKVGECTSKIIETNGKKIGIIGLSMVYGEFNRQQANEIVKKIASSTDLVIVNIHWGVEYEHQFNKLQQNIAHGFIGAGADIIIGHHPHVVQGMEIYNDKPIFYSLGNFIFDQYFSPDTQEGLGVEVDINASGSKILLLPLESKASQVGLMSTAEKEKFLQKFINWSRLDSEFNKQLSTGQLEI